MYELAAKLATKAEKGQSYKTALYATKNKKIVRSVHFLVGNAVRRQVLIDKLLGQAGLEDVLKAEPWLARVALAQLLWGRWRLPTSTPLFRKIIRHKETFLKILPTLEKEIDSKDDVNIPRYIRINTDVLHKEQALSQLKDLGFLLLQTPSTYSAFLGAVCKLKRNEFLCDFNVPNLIVFNKKAKISSLTPGSFIRQDKSSCLVSLLLAPLPGSSILDMCAAPGYKTQHAASLLYNMGTLYSVEVNAQRFKTLEETRKTFGLEEICRPLKMDALKVSEDTCPDVEYIIVDPPCSGTGMVNVLMRHSADEDRLRKLSNLQAMMLKHALSSFSCARRVVYSTCSVMEEENEKVVSECLEVAEGNGFRLVPLAAAFRGSFAQGVGPYSCAPSVLRTTPEDDLTNGFFIALFERSVPPTLPSCGNKTSLTNGSCIRTDLPSPISNNEPAHSSNEQEFSLSDDNTESDEGEYVQHTTQLEQKNSSKTSLSSPNKNSKSKKNNSSESNREDLSFHGKFTLQRNLKSSSKKKLVSKGFKKIIPPLGVKKKMLDQAKLPQSRKRMKLTFHSNKK